MAPPDRPRPPSVERVLAAARARLATAPSRGAGNSAGDRTTPPARAALVRATRQVVDAERQRLSADGAGGVRSIEELASAVVEKLDAVARGWAIGLEPAINATGVIVHTNLGRAPWPAVAIDAARAAAGEPLLLELDRGTGRRGRRYRAAEDHLVALTGAEDALVTNNNAAAVALAVRLAGRGGGVVVSRGELIEIGGGVRIPEIVRRAGARLIEVGTTNRTRAADYEPPLADGRGRLLLRVHRSNFRLAGFTEDPDPVRLAELGRRHGAIVVDDLGSGALLDTAAYGMAHEPMPSERLAAGADVVTFSGDKLVGGPQAGLVVGRADLVERMRKDPLARAMRPDKVTLAAVAATLGLYAAGRAASEIPVWRMIAAAPAELEERARALAGRVGGEAVAVESTVGGGSLPGETLASWGVALARGSAERVLTELRQGTPPVVARIERERVVLDLRTVDPAHDDRLAEAVNRAIRAVGDRR